MSRGHKAAANSFIDTTGSQRHAQTELVAGTASKISGLAGFTRPFPSIASKASQISDANPCDVEHKPQVPRQSHGLHGLCVSKRDQALSE